MASIVEKHAKREKARLKIAQQKNAIAQKEAKIKAAERIERRIEWLVVGRQLEGKLSIYALDGLVMLLESGRIDAKTISAWEKVGRVGKAVDAEPAPVEPSILPAAAE